MRRLTGAVKVPMLEGVKGAVTMTVAAIDTLALARQAMNEILAEQVATKADISALRTELQLLEQRLTIKVGAMIIALGSFMAAIKFFG
jgi:hypothetical protein